MENQAHKTIIESYISAYNNFDIVNMLKDMHKDIKFENISGGKINLTLSGIEEFRAQAKIAEEYFSKREIMITKMNFSKEKLEIEIVYKAKVAKDIPDGPVKGDLIELEGKSVFKFKSNKIIELTDIS